jgi:hypothetical protein
MPVLPSLPYKTIHSSHSELISFIYVSLSLSTVSVSSMLRNSEVKETQPERKHDHGDIVLRFEDYDPTAFEE